MVSVEAGTAFGTQDDDVKIRMPGSPSSLGFGLVGSTDANKVDGKVVIATGGGVAVLSSEGAGERAGISTTGVLGGVGGAGGEAGLATCC